MPTPNKPLAIMAADVITQAFCFGKTVVIIHSLEKLKPPQMQPRARCVSV